MPDFDPGALETLLLLAEEQNNRDLWAILPKQAGSVAAVVLATYADGQGTLDGKPITVHHLMATLCRRAVRICSAGREQVFAGGAAAGWVRAGAEGVVLTLPKSRLCRRRSRAQPE